MTDVDHPKCAVCGQAATCFGEYENMRQSAFACDNCCQHSQEDGSCEKLELEWSAAHEDAVLHADTSGSFEASVLRASRYRVVPNTGQDEVEVKFEVPEGRGREFVERVHVAILKVRDA